jgi:ABC-2 type transport system permease protein
VSQFLGVIRHEFNMSVRRPGMWIAYLILYAFFGVIFFAPNAAGEITILFPAGQIWQGAGYILFYCNMFMVLLGGILSADRLQRDFRLGVRELQQSTPLRLPVYILAKYLGVLTAVALPMLVWVMLVGLYAILTQGAPIQLLGILFVVFLAMGIPAYAFVVAFSLACPLVMPVRVYQVLFVGYWFWGNYLSPGAFPTISDTLLVPSGKYVIEGFLGGFPTTYANIPPAAYTSTDAILNLSVLALCILAVLVALHSYLRWQTQRA